MIGYCAADPNYFDLYFDMWATRMNIVYPKMRKIVAVYNPSEKTERRCNEYGVELRAAELTDNPGRPHFYLLRWLNLPYDTGDLIVETQINCLAVKPQIFDKSQTVDHLRIARHKSGGRTGGVSAAVFTPTAAERVVAQAKIMLKNPIDDDHPMNSWQHHNLSWEKVVTEQQFKEIDQPIEPWCCWITSGTGKKFSADWKLGILNHYMSRMQNNEL
jgi:hypothetical protein